MAKKKKDPEPGSAEWREAHKNHPWVSNYPSLAEWLEKHEARCMWQVPMQCEHSSAHENYGHPTAYIECYIIPKAPRLFIVVVHAGQHGWEMYTALDDNNIVNTLADVEKRIGLGRPK